MTAVEKPALPIYQRAAQYLSRGDLVAFPTETVYGLGADAYNPDAVEKIFSAKGRPGDNPLIVHVEDLSKVPPLIDGPMSEKARALAKAFWPGPLTMIFPKSARVPDAVTAGLLTVAVRVPRHVVAQGLLRVFARPIAAPSANRSGRPSPTTARHVLDDLDGWLPLIIDGGACEIGLESSVVDMTCDPPRLLRPGGVTVEMLEAVVGGIRIDRAVTRQIEDGARPASPGTKYKHYAPMGQMTLVNGEADRVVEKIRALYDAAAARGERVAILAPGMHAARYGARRVCALGAEDAAEDAARALFGALRALDDDGIERIYAESFARAGIGLALMNRLTRAAGFCQIDA
jgi:L-threonylcarbamoyladenylate synthase